MEMEEISGQQCEICFEAYTSTGQQMITIFDPCGHSCCLECYDLQHQSPEHVCHKCREVVKKGLRSYAANEFMEEREKLRRENQELKDKMEEQMRQMEAQNKNLSQSSSEKEKQRIEQIATKRLEEAKRRQEEEEKKKSQEKKNQEYEEMRRENQRLQSLLSENGGGDLTLRLELDKQKFRIGDTVKVINLVNQQSLNGSIGDVIAVLEEKDKAGTLTGVRFNVELQDNGQKIGIKPLNLVLATLEDYIPSSAKNKKPVTHQDLFSTVQSACVETTKNIKPNKRIVDNLELVDYGDGDQSKLPGMKGHQFRILWSAGMDIHEHFNNHFINCNELEGLAEFLKSCFFGHHKKIDNILSSLSLEDKMKLLDRRISKMRFSCLFVLIYGSKVISGSPSSKYLESLEVLIKHGVNLHAKDCGGYTVIHHCFSSSSNAIAQSLGEMMLSKGVSPNVPNRMGGVPLMECVMNNMVPAIKVLLAYGADPEIADYDNCKPSKLCSYSREIQTLFQQQIIRLKDEREKEKKNEKSQPNACVNVGEEKKFVLCDKCNKQLPRQSFSATQWKKHKGAHCMVCTGQAASHEIEFVKEENKPDKNAFVVLQKEIDQTQSISPGKKGVFSNIHTNPLTGKTTMTTKDLKSPSSKNPINANIKFLVKIQVPMGSNGKDALWLYNEKRNVSRFIDPSDPSYIIIFNAVREKGLLGGAKAYFNAFFNNNGDLCVCHEDIQPIQKW